MSGSQNRDFNIQPSDTVDFTNPHSGRVKKITASKLKEAVKPTETDPIFRASPAYGITNTDITNWDLAYDSRVVAAAFSGTTTKTLTLTKQDGGIITASFTDSAGANDYLYSATFDDATGDLTLEVLNQPDVVVSLDGRYLTSFTEVDPVFTASPAFGITNLDISAWDNTALTVTAKEFNWDSAFGWGDWSVGVDKAFVEGLGIDVPWSNLTGVPTFDNYVSWNLKTGGVQRLGIVSNGSVDFVGSGATSVVYSGGGVVTISSANDNTTYSAGTGLQLIGTVFSIDSTVATKSWVGSQGYITTETDPVFTASPAFGISTSDINAWSLTALTVNGLQANWDAAFSWGDWSVGVNKAFVDALNVDADTLDGFNSTAFEKVANKGAASGYVPLNASSKIEELYLPDSILGQVTYQGTWNANTDTPTLPNATTVKGDYYVVNTAGTYNSISYAVGDWVISNGTSWEKVDNSDAVTTVFGRIGNVLAIEGDYSAFYPRLSQSYANPSWISSLAWSKITGTPTTLSGYGITNTYTDNEINSFFSGGTAITGYNKTAWDTAFAWGDWSGGVTKSFVEALGINVPWANVTGKPTYDNYVSWNLRTNGVQRTTITSNGILDIVGGGSTSVSYSAGGVVTVSSIDNNTTYSAGTGLDLIGTVFSIDSTVATETWSDGRFLKKNPDGIGNKRFIKTNSSGNVADATTSISGGNLDTGIGVDADGYATWGSTQPATGSPGFSYGAVLQKFDGSQDIQLAFGSSSAGRLAVRRRDSGTFYTWTEFASQDWVLSQSFPTSSTLQDVTTNGNTTNQGINVSSGDLVVSGTNGGANALEVWRTTNDLQSLRVIVDDNNAIFYSNQDEDTGSSGGFRFLLDNGGDTNAFSVEKGGTTYLSTSDSGTVISQELDVSGNIRANGSLVLTEADYDTYVCHLKTNQNTAIQEGSANEFTVDFNIETHNDTSFFSHTNGVVTVLETGWYRVYTNMVYENSTSSARNTIRAFVKKNGTEILSTRAYDYNRGASYGRFSNSKIETMLYLTANDTVEIANYAFNEDGTATIEAAECEFIVNSVAVSANTTNADTLDGEHGSYYRNASNLNAGTIDDARLSNGVVKTTGNQDIGGVKTFTSNSIFDSSVGIGTDNPQSRLHVYQPSGANGFRLTRSDNITGVGLDFQVDSTVNRINGYGDLTFRTAPIGNGTNATERFRITTGGNVGINTTNPSTLLHVQQSGVYTGLSGTAAINIKGSGASAINNYHGAITFSRGTGHAAIAAVQEAGDSDVMGLAFFTHPSSTGGAAAVEAMRLDQSGRLAIGKTSASSTLDVAGDVEIEESLGVGVAASSTTGRIDASNDIIAFSSSDRRWKENITPITSALSKLLEINGVEFDWKNLNEVERRTQHSNTGHDIGVIAQEIEAIIPQAVTTRENGYKAVDYKKIIPLLIETVKELNHKVDSQEERLTILEQQCS